MLDDEHLWDKIEEIKFFLYLGFFVCLFLFFTLALTVHKNSTFLMANRALIELSDAGVSYSHHLRCIMFGFYQFQFCFSILVLPDSLLQLKKKWQKKKTPKENQTYIWTVYSRGS